MKRDSNEVLLSGDVAREGDVTPATARVWADKGLLPVSRTISGRRLYRRDDVDRFLEQRRLLKRESGR